jgi:tellurite resistance protein TerC
VGVKMLITYFDIHVPIGLSLGVIAGILVGSIVASLIWPKAYQPSEGKTGSMFGRLPPES